MTLAASPNWIGRNSEIFIDGQSYSFVDANSILSHRPNRTDIHESCVEVDANNRYYASPIDVAEREYRQHFQPSFTFDGQQARPTQAYQSNICVDEYAVGGARTSAVYQTQQAGCAPQESTTPA